MKAKITTSNTILLLIAIWVPSTIGLVILWELLVPYKLLITILILSSMFLMTSVILFLQRLITDTINDITNIFKE